MNAIAIVEILSDSTQDYDRGDKFTAYKTMPDFQDYLLVSQTQVSVEHYEKTNNNWQSKVYTDRTATVTLTSLGVTIGLEDLYPESDLRKNPEDMLVDRPTGYNHVG